MKKRKLCARILAGLLSAALLMPSAFAADGAGSGSLKFSLTPLEDIEYWYIAEVFGTTFEEKRTFHKLLDDFKSVDSFDSAYSCYTDPTNLKDENDVGEYKCIDKVTDLFSQENISNLSMAIMISNKPGASQVDSTITASQKIEVEGRNLRIGTYNFSETVTLKVPGIAVKNGSLSFQNYYDGKSGGSYQNFTNQVMVVELSEPITLSDGGKLYMDRRNYSPNTIVRDDTLIAPAGQNAIEINGDGAEAHLGYFTVKRSESDTTETALIDVESGALYLEEGVAKFLDDNGMPNFDGGTSAVWPETYNVHLNNGSSSAPAIKVNSGAKVVVKGGQLSAEGDAPVIAVEEGGTITISGDETINIKSEGEGTPAITLAEGATLSFESEGAPEITAENNRNVAIEIAGGATVQRAGRTLHVADAVIEEGPQAVVDNAGNIIVKPGATVDDSGESMNAAVILTDGTLIEGSESEAPTVDTATGTTTVNVPAGGKVTDSTGKITELPGGGTVTSADDKTEVEVTEIPATGISLNQTELSLTPGETSALTATVAPDNATDKTVNWTSSDTSVATVDENGNVTAVAPGTATITATANGGSGKSASCEVTVAYPYVPPVITNPSYAVTVAPADNGVVTVNPSAARKGELVTITAAPSASYELASLTVTDRFGNAVEVSATLGSWTFTMPGSQVTVSAVFAEKAPEAWVNPFVDVKANDWFYSAVEYACRNGLMNGTSAVTFEPMGTVTRGTVAAILWRLAGSPVVNYLMTFPDVAGGQWYSEAVRWAASEGVITGYDNGNFGPSDPITREQLAVMLYRYAQKQGEGFTGAWAFPLDYADAEQVSAYAYEAMCWMTMKGVVNGRDGLLAPQGTATRAELAVMLMRFCENI